MGQQWTRALSDLRHFKSTGHRPAGVATAANATAKPHVQILEKDVLALCEDGDLLLMREQVTNANLRVTMDPVVARDISRMQHGQFPAQRVTSLPGTYAAAQLRQQTALGRLADHYAIRRLLHVKSYGSSEILRSLVYEIASLLPFQWHQFQSSAANAGTEATTSSDTTATDPPTTGPAKQLTPVLSQLLHKMLKVFHRSLELGDSRNTEASKLSTTTHEAGLDTPSSSEPTLSSAPDGDLFSLDHLPEHDKQTLERVDVDAILSTALVAAVYEHIGVVKPINDVSSLAQPLGPTVFWTGNADHHVLALHDSNALGDEMYLQQSTHR